MERKLIDYLPYVVRDYDVFQGMMAGEQPEFEAVWQMMKELLDHQFILTAGHLGLSRWEKLLGILPKREDSLEIRRNRILLRLREQLPFTLRRLRQVLEALCGEGKATAETEDYLLKVTVDLAAQPYLEDVTELLLRMTPANLLLSLYLLFTADPVARCQRLIPVTHGGFSETRLGEIAENR